MEDERLPSTRRYDAPVRARRAARSRAQILDAAQQLFVARGYAATTLAEIASTAGLSVETVYKHFGNKATVLRQVVTRVVVGEDADLDATGGVRAGVLDDTTAIRDPRERLAATVDAALAVFVPLAPLQRVIEEAASTDADLRALLERNREIRAAAIRRGVASYVDEGSLAVDPDEAVDVLWLILSPRSYLELARDRGWTTDRFRRWATDTLATLLLRDGGARPLRGRPDDRERRPNGLVSPGETGVSL